MPFSEIKVGELFMVSGIVYMKTVRQTIGVSSMCYLQPNYINSVIIGCVTNEECECGEFAFFDEDDDVQIANIHHDIGISVNQEGKCLYLKKD